MFPETYDTKAMVLNLPSFINKDLKSLKLKFLNDSSLKSNV